MKEWTELSIFEKIKVSHGSVVIFMVFGFLAVMYVQLDNLGGTILMAMIATISFTMTEAFKTRYIIRQEIRQLKKKKGGM